MTTYSCFCEISATHSCIALYTNIYVLLGYMLIGQWRWFDDNMLDCCEPLEKVQVSGISFSKVACLAHCNGAEVEAFHTNESSIDEFRNHLISCTSSENFHMIVSYHRGYLEQVCRF